MQNIYILSFRKTNCHGDYLIFMDTGKSIALTYACTHVPFVISASAFALPNNHPRNYARGY